jgi:hypothetical protein
VQFLGGDSANVDMARPASGAWAEVLDSMQRAGQPVYVEVEPTSRVVTVLLLPLVSTVEAVTANAEGGFDVEFIDSHARHKLQPDQAEYQELLEILEAARLDRGAVVVTETPDTHEIFDVRRSSNAPAGNTPGTAAPTGPATASASSISEEEAKKLFTAMNTKTCSPKAPSLGCIPFQYPDDGCWGRAHEMCRLIIAEGKATGKVWIYGKLKAKTKNHPKCFVEWGWHVAPTVNVHVGTNDVVHVIDPSLFSSHVTQPTWVSVQGDASAQVVASDADVFRRAKDGTVTMDLDFSKTKAVLEKYRNELKLRATSSVGPPPYSNCA